jgi:error-prone DNA polymerase
MIRIYIQVLWTLVIKKSIRMSFTKVDGLVSFSSQSRGAQKFAVQAQPRSIIDIAAITSIYRPGPLSAEVDKAYVEAKDNPSGVKYLNDTVKRLPKRHTGS